MTQRIFDRENEQDMTDLWDILPDDANKIEKDGDGIFIYYKNENCARDFVEVFNINWHDKTEITRPIQEATETDIGKLCYFWDDDEEYKGYAILTLKDVAGGKPYYIADGNTTYNHCRRLTKQEIEELC